MDVFSRRERSRIMSRIRSRGNAATELRLIHLFHAHKITGWRRNQRLPGKPDFVFREKHVAVFVDGCFWHGCPKHATNPKSNRAYWRHKLSGNKSRDRLVTRTLRLSGWHVLRIWHHELKRKNESRLLRRLERALR